MRRVVGVAVAATVVAACSGGGGHHAARSKPTTSRPGRAATSTTATSTSTVPPGTSTTTTTQVRHLVVAQGTTTTEAPPVCYNSTDYRCGPFHWVVVNQPAEIDAHVVTAPPLYVDNHVDAYVHASDPDSVLPCVVVGVQAAPPGSDPTTSFVGQDIHKSVDCGEGGCRLGTTPWDYGPWWLPPLGSTNASGTLTISGKLPPGHYAFWLDTASGDCVSLGGEKPDPYSSQANTTLEFDVVASPTTTTT